MSEWQSLKTFDDWAAKLDELLDEAQTATTSDARVAAQKRLRTYRNESPLFAADLDVIARDAISDLTAAQLGESVLAISERSAELDELRKHLSHVTAGAERAASWINLDGPTEIVKSMTDVMTEFVALKRKFEQEGAAAVVIEDVESARTAIAKLRESIETHLQ